jgi:type III restriction enzyme
MADKSLYEELDSASNLGLLEKNIPDYLKNNLNPKFELRPYQEEAFARFFHCMYNEFPNKKWPLHFLFNMATGSGKTLIMAGLILYLYEKGYRNFLFFVNSTNIIEKTKENFLNSLSSKYLFAENISFGIKTAQITQTSNFEGVNENDINICFTTIQKLHLDLTTEKENSLTFEDFKDKKIVLLADEAHHMNTRTKKQKEMFESWENTVERIFHQNENNLLLEYTATLDYSNFYLARKYKNKVLYRYDLRQFRNDKYSKDVYIVQADFKEKHRIIQALILSQYKQEVAAKHRINLKPVILFKAQKTIDQSLENKANFHKLIEQLSEQDIDRIREKSDIPLVKRTFQFFDDNHISHRQLAERLRHEFDESRCISVNEEKEKEKQQILLNTLEDKDNGIRAIFAVQKLNEGWDVLNLFDIVRCYTTRDSKGGKPGKTSIAEAQLIGRGARYFPFTTKEHIEPFKRKYDRNLEHELRVLEELHYHSINDSRYISELRTALIEEGMIDEKEINKELKLKNSFKETDFYKSGLLYLNERVINDYEHVISFSDMGITKKNYEHKLASGRGMTDTLLTGGGEDKEKVAESGRKDIKIKEITKHIIHNAIAKLPFFTFKSIHRYFPHISSMREFIESQDYLGSLEITFQGESEELYNLSNRVLFEGVLGLLEQLESELVRNRKEYIGTEEFKFKLVSDVFKDKVLKLPEDSEQANGDEHFVKDRDWYVFNANYGTSEEKDFVRMLERQIETLKEKHDGIYLVRNERHFKLYNFKDGQGFEPDFVLFLRAKNGEMLTYQIFIEPKGRHLNEYDKWKQAFLKEITENFKGETLEFATQSKKEKYRLVGMLFYNNKDENKFKQEFRTQFTEDLI